MGRFICLIFKTLTEKYYEDKKNGTIIMAEEASERVADVLAVLDSIYDSKAGMPENARRNTVEITLYKDKLNSRAFQELWSRINGKTYYVVDFDEVECVF